MQVLILYLKKQTAKQALKKTPKELFPLKYLIAHSTTVAIIPFKVKYGENTCVNAIKVKYGRYFQVK